MRITLVIEGEMEVHFYHARRKVLHAHTVIERRSTCAKPNMASLDSHIDDISQDVHAPKACSRCIAGATDAFSSLLIDRKC